MYRLVRQFSELELNMHCVERMVKNYFILFFHDLINHVSTFLSIYVMLCCRWNTLT